MTATQASELRIALRTAIANAISEVGIDAFKRTSWFGSNEIAKSELKKAA